MTTVREMKSSTTERNLLTEAAKNSFNDDAWIFHPRKPAVGSSRTEKT